MNLSQEKFNHIIDLLMDACTCESRIQVYKWASEPTFNLEIEAKKALDSYQQELSILYVTETPNIFMDTFHNKQLTYKKQLLENPTIINIEAQYIMNLKELFDKLNKDAKTKFSYTGKCELFGVNYLTPTIKYNIDHSKPNIFTQCLDFTLPSLSNPYVLYGGMFLCVVSGLVVPHSIVFGIVIAIAGACLISGYVANQYGFFNKHSNDEVGMGSLSCSR